MDRPFYHLGAEDRVPRDAAHVVVGGSIEVVARRTFRGYRNLARVELRKGVEVIGADAFRECRNLTRVDWPSSLRTIDDWAFAGCRRLSEAILREGLRRIGMGAFYECDLRRIAVPSSLVTIGDYAFAWCERLSKLILREGLRRIATRAFYRCALGRITVPSSVVEIEEEAFAHCNNLKTVRLAGGMALVARGVFFHCPQLERIEIYSMAIVVEAGEDGNGRVAAVTGGIKRDSVNESPRLILASPHLASMRPDDLTSLTDAIDRVVATTQGGGPLDLADGDVSDQIRNGFVDHLSTWYRWYKREAATILELGLWKIELGRVRVASASRAAGGGKRAGADVPTRDDCRRTCGAVPIVGLVLSSLAGPHRRAD